MEVKPVTTKDLRNFGLVMAGAIIIIGLIRYAIHGFDHFPLYFFIVAAVFAAFGVIVPKALGPVYWAWIRFGLALNWVMTRVLLFLVFTLFIIPGRIILAIRRIDPLKRAWDPEMVSYWEEPDEQPEQLERYYNQF